MRDKQISQEVYQVKVDFLGWSVWLVIIFSKNHVSLYLYSVHVYIIIKVIAL